MINLYTTDGKVQKFRGRKSAAELRKLIGGYLEELKISKDWQVFLDEEGIPKGLKINMRASKLLDFPVRGNVLVITGKSRIVWG